MEMVYIETETTKYYTLRVNIDDRFYYLRCNTETAELGKAVYFSNKEYTLFSSRMFVNSTLDTFIIHAFKVCDIIMRAKNNDVANLIYRNFVNQCADFSLLVILVANIINQAQEYHEPIICRDILEDKSNLVVLGDVSDPSSDSNDTMLSYRLNHLPEDLLKRINIIFQLQDES